MPAIEKEQGEQRIVEARKRLREKGGDALVLSPGNNHYYLSGNPEKQVTPRHTFFILPVEGEPFMFLSTNNASNVRESSWINTFVTWDDSDDPVDRLADAFEEYDISDESTILVEDQMWATFIKDFQEISDFEFELASEVTMPLRRTKDEDERKTIKEAASIADEVSEIIRSENLVGMTENEVAAKIDYLMRKRGAEDTAFDTVVASGPNSTKPSYTVGQRSIQSGEPVILDFGAQVDQYLSDQTRTVVFDGEPPEEFIEAFEVARKAQEAAIDAVEPGVQAKEVDVVARSVIEDAGYGENFLHVTGHGIGLGIHEPPFLMSGDYVDEGNEIELQPGMVMTIEPGIYTEDWGLRIEDDVAVTQSGCERLSNSSHGWRLLE
ncbi:M24 family metallopeptidase [Halorarius halobius]|uniref:M24 family metallopeptidase n=1 Tax=Halorarius halobius TaxID=2962671 RepID=UPI0020CDCEAC|nr:Xaa-Pro peptidase family protein [Halorarius halobius]